MPPSKLSFAIAYTENSYSLVKTCDSLGIDYTEGRKFERDPLVRACIQDIQKQLEGIDILNEQWVNAKIMELMPMVMGEVPVAMVDQKTGEEYDACKFMPEVAVRLLEMKMPSKASKINVNVSRVDDNHLESLASRLVNLMDEKKGDVIQPEFVERVE